jgi:[ribosomal protein S5]-alanine N-acetyltransferase
MFNKKTLLKPENLFKNLPYLETERLKLRKLTARDAGDVFEYASVTEVSLYVSWMPHRTIADTKSFLKHVLFQYEKGIPSSWGIVLKETGKLIGTIGFHWWSTEHSKAELGYVISDKYWNQGYTTEALRKILQFGFEIMQLERIEARCFTENAASERVMQKCGMKLEGILRSSLFIKGGFRDFKLYSILKTEYI